MGRFTQSNTRRNRKLTKSSYTGTIQERESKFGTMHSWIYPFLSRGINQI
jgi:hypothetical protein